MIIIINNEDENFGKDKFIESSLNELDKYSPTLKESVKGLSKASYDKGLAVGVYSISFAVLNLLRSEKNAEKAKMKVIAFLKENKSVKETDDKQKKKGK